tara:strand:- start:155 stop:526 length:372 start_codon:yes stop_codon:yes gene_type:complete
MINGFTISLAVVFALSLVFNIILFLYFRRVLFQIYFASEEASKIFTMIDAYESHLRSVYELQTYYGDETIKSLLDHTKDIHDFLDQYDEVYSFTQPDLREQLAAASKEMEQRYEEKDQAQKEE